MGSADGVGLASRGHLHDSLLEDIADGITVPTRASKSAQSAALDGLTPAGTRRLARIGQSSHAARDYARHAKRIFPFLRDLDFYDVKAPFKKADDLGIEFEYVPIFYPMKLLLHFMIYNMMTLYLYSGPQSSAVSIGKMQKRPHGLRLTQQKISF